MTLGPTSYPKTTWEETFAGGENKLPWFKLKRRHGGDRNIVTRGKESQRASDRFHGRLSKNTQEEDIN